jgi:hypothetical protein
MIQMLHYALFFISILRATVEPMNAVRSERARMRRVANASPPKPVLGTPGTEGFGTGIGDVPAAAVIETAPEIGSVLVGVVVAPEALTAEIEDGSTATVKLLPTGATGETSQTIARRVAVPAKTTSGTLKWKVTPLPVNAATALTPLESGKPSAAVFCTEQLVKSVGGTPLKESARGKDETTMFCPECDASSITVASATCEEPAGTDGAVERDTAKLGAACALAIPIPRPKRSAARATPPPMRDMLFIRFDDY